MARKATTLVASALLLAVVAFLSHDAGVEAWCLEYPAPDPNACRGKNGLRTCRGKNGLRTCRDECLDVGAGFAGGECNNNGDCLCVKCADEPPAPHTL